MSRRNPFWFLFYNLVVVPLLYLGVQITRPFNAKVRRGYHEHRGLFQRLNDIRKNLPSQHKLIVLHCASAGEFEAARPGKDRFRTSTLPTSPRPD
jgi:3-deoxy-D-manno-octulosonic-acid transferase